jgi:F-type H+-transporting ATPase subunit b
LEGLGINLGYLISQIINFVLLLFILRQFLYKPIVGMLDRRSEKIRTDLQEAEEARSKAEAARQEYEQQLEQARDERRSIVAQATEQAEKMKEDVLAEARAEATEIASKAQDEMEYERRQVLRQAQDQIVDLALAAAGRVVGESLDEKAHRRLIQEFIAEVGELQ